ncbi:restriction endonuclease subunit S [Xanthomonas medicagonis]|uniref:restriction endonuclease subunit S n=1 Tax=Xanthomonas medicagonis TaxID=3160841 RepID=UPI003517FC08
MALTKSIAEIISEDTSGLLGIHPTWSRVRLAEIASVLNGFPFESVFFTGTTGIPLIRIRNISEGKTQTRYNGPYENRFIVNTGDLLIGMDGDFHATCWKGEQALLNQRVCKITPNENFYHPKLIEYALPGYLNAINAATSSITVKHLSSKSIEEIDLPLPPIGEQTRIAGKLEELLSDLDAGVAELKAAQRKLVRYRQSLLKAAVEGTLTADWRAARAQTGEPQETGAELLQRILSERRARWEAKQLAKFAKQGKNPPKGWQDKYPAPVLPKAVGLHALPVGWAWASLDMIGEIASGVAKGTKRSSATITREVPYLRVANVQRGYLDLTQIKTIAATEADIEELRLQPGDVLFNEGGDLDKLGRGWVWQGELKECIHQNHVFRVRPYLSGTPSELISHHGNTFGKDWFKTAGKQTTNLASINMKMLREFPIPVAAELEGRKILEILSPMLDILAAQEKSIELGLKQAAAQRKNILKAAFTGQLVSQDPNDEPASVLLERIRAARVAAGAKRTGKTARKTKECT